MHVNKINIEPTYKKDNGSWAIDTQKISLKSLFTTVEQAIIFLPPNKVAGNHKHKRKEALLGIGEAAFFLWQDANGRVHKEAMNPNGMLYLFIIPPDIPHAVINESASMPVILYEYFDDVFKGIEKVDLLRRLEIS